MSNGQRHLSTIIHGLHHLNIKYQNAKTNKTTPPKKDKIFRQRSNLFQWSNNACKPKFKKNDTSTIGCKKNQKIKKAWSEYLEWPHPRLKHPNSQKIWTGKKLQRMRNAQEMVTNGEEERRIPVWRREISTKGLLPGWERLQNRRPLW